MKLALVGKGGAGKTTVAALLARRCVALGRLVVAVDADPDGNLGSALGVSAQSMPLPIAQMRDLILERTEAKNEGAGLMFRLNPRVDDLPERFSVKVDGIRLLVLGTVEAGGKGCMCPETAVLKALTQHLLLRIDDDVILDMEAGLEHLGRASARGVDALLVVVEPGMRSVQTAVRIQKLARDIGIERIYVVLNRVRSDEEEQALRGVMPEVKIVGVLPFAAELARADLEGRAADVSDTNFNAAFSNMVDTLENNLAQAATVAK